MRLQTTLLAALLASPLAFAGDTNSTAADAKPTSESAPTGIEMVLAGDWRSDEDRQRDQYRHPVQTLSFFGIKADDTVVEITPGGGWYAEILAPLLRDHGHYVAAVWDDRIEGQPAYRYKLNAALRERFASDEAVYGKPDVRVFDPKAPDFGPSDSADAVLTFRNAHNWVADDTGAAYFKAFFNVLKPGGTLGVVDHRAKPGTNLETMKKSGYLTEALVIGLATEAGFELVSRSEANANPKDDTDHPNGVWTLPPSMRHDEADHEKYRAIGESDRMTLRFVKPKKAAPAH